MPFVWNFPLFTIVLCLFSGVLCMMLRGRTARNYTIVLEAVLIVMVSAVLWYTYTAGSAFTYSMGEFPAPWGNEIRAGCLEALIALTFLIVMLCSVIGGWRFIAIDIDESKINLYFSILNLMTAALMAMAWTNDIFTGYVFVEILTLTSCGVLIAREIGRTTLAAVRYMILNLLGSGLFLLGVVLLYDLTGNLLMVPMHEAIEELWAAGQGIAPLTLAMGIITIGLGIKSGLFPFHYWMPDTYGMATPTSGAVLSSLVSKSYIFLLIKIVWRVVGLDIWREMPVARILFVLGICGMVAGSMSAIRVNNINSMVAFSSAAQIGYIYMGIGLGGPAGFTAAIFHILGHAVTKSLLFLTTPRLAEVSGDSLRFKDLQGSGYRAPESGAFFMLAALSMIGIPIFAGFSSKILFGIAAADEGGWRFFVIMLALALSTLLNVLYFLRTVIRIYTRRGSDLTKPAIDMPGGVKWDYVLPAAVLTLANLFLGLFSWAAVDIIEKGFGMFF